MDPGIAHRLTLHTDQESSGGIADQLLIQVDSTLHVVVCRRRKPCLHRGRDKRKPQTCALLERYRCLYLHTPE